MQLRTSTPDSTIKLVLYLQILGVGMGRGVKQVIFFIFKHQSFLPISFPQPDSTLQ